jgi:hypothetical protein
METITEVIVSKNRTGQNIIFNLPIEGEVEVDGEFYYNEDLERYEHTATDEDGTKYLIIW